MANDFGILFSIGFWVSLLSADVCNSLSYLLLQKVTPYYRSDSQSSIRKFSASTSYLASLPPSSGPTPSTPLYSINPTLSLPVTPIKLNGDLNVTKLTSGTSGYLSESPPSDKGIVTIDRSTCS